MNECSKIEQDRVQLVAIITGAACRFSAEHHVVLISSQRLVAADYAEKTQLHQQHVFDHSNIFAAF
jgi:hypothetical protein